jgi:hypothetical protein
LLAEWLLTRIKNMAKRCFLSGAALASQQAKRARLAEEAAAAI